jgi:hypothetical protein
MQFSNRILSLMLVVVLSGCGGGNVLLGGYVPKPETAPQPSPLVGLYYDRGGDLYPGTLLRVGVPDTAFRGILHQFKLEAHFAETRRLHRPSFWDAVLDSLHLDRDAETTALWTAIQDSLNQRGISRITSAVEVEGGGRRTLVVLVHGFNNDPGAAEAGYAEYRRVLSDSGFAHPQRTTYLRLYWDGLVNDLGIPIWSRAQFNFPLVGVSFRRILNRVPHDVPVRILTHSSGGPLISNTLWNASWPIESNVHTATWARYKWYREHVGDQSGTWAVPNHPDLRVGMIVPAMPGETFHDFPNTAGGPSRIIIGANPNDVAIRKFGIPTSWNIFWLSCRQSGSTCLPARRSQYCQQVRARLEGDPDTQLALIDFSRHRSRREPRSAYIFDVHDVGAYLRRKDMTRFLTMVFADHPNVPTDDALWCS